ncbi:MAG: hypothetical protein V1660_00340 [archaeon]
MNKILAKVRYPKFLLLILTFVIAYILFSGRNFPLVNNALSSLGYLGTFLAGILYVYGFTAAPATAILLILAKQQNILAAGLIAGFGSLLGDLVIFNFIRLSFDDEIERISKEKAVVYLEKKMPPLLKKYLIPVLAGFIIASPLPDEIGVSLLAASRSISLKAFSVLSYVLNTGGIFVILIMGKLI